MKVAAIIPSRYQSTRFDGKPLALINGKTMIQRVYENSNQANCITDIFVATDDKRIFEAVVSFGGNAILTSKLNKSGTDRVAEAAEKIGLSNDDIIINVQGDQPMISPICLDEVANPLIQNSNIEMSTLAFKTILEHEINGIKDVKVTFDNKGFALYFSRSPIPIARDNDINFDTFKHLGIYAYTKKFIDIFRTYPESTLEKIEKLEMLRALENGHKIKVVVTKFDSPEVDLPEDIQRIEKLL